MISIDSNSTLSSVNAIAAAGQQAQGSSALAAGAAAGSDTVSLSPTAQAAALQQQGLTIKEIASNMGVTTATVDGYLDITTASTSGGGVPSGGPRHSAATKTVAAASGASKAAGESTSSPAVGEFHG